MPSERRILPLLPWVAALVLASILGFWFRENFERRIEEIDAGLSAEARRNGFLAAERFLRRLGFEAESVAGRGLVRELPDPRHILVVDGLASLNAERREALRRWISAGGRLLAAPAEPWEEGDEQSQGDFLAGYGVRLQKLAETESQERMLATVEFEEYPHQLKLELDGRYALVDEAENADGGVAAEGHYRLLQYDLGDGQLTVMSDMGPFTNAHIGERDHALLLALLTESDDGGKVWLLYDSQVPWLGALLWERAPFALLSAACLTIALLWRLGGRLGPLLPRSEPRRRDLLVHLQALADFHWRFGREGHLTGVSRERVEQGWLARHPVLRGMERAPRASWIGRRAGLSSDEVQASLYPSPGDHRNLVTKTRLLQRLWTALSHSRSARQSENEASTTNQPNETGTTSKAQPLRDHSLDPRDSKFQQLEE